MIPTDPNRPKQGVWVLDHCDKPDCGTITICMIDPEMREVKEVMDEGNLVPALDIDADQALKMAMILIEKARDRIYQAEEEK